MVNSCAVFGCRSSSRNNADLKFHRIPAGERGKLWIEACRRPELLKKNTAQLRNSYVCEKHFGDWMYINTKLKPCAVPALCLAPNLLQTTGTQTRLSLPADARAPSWAVPSASRLPSKTNLNLSKVVKSITRQKRKSYGYSTKLKNFALNVYFSNPQAYRFISRTLHLPTIRNLAATPLPISTKLTDDVKCILSKALRSLSSLEKECVLCMGKIALKPFLSYSPKRDKINGFQEIDNVQSPYVARFAFTLTLRSITSDWHQPIGYAFIRSGEIEGDLQTWITGTIKQLWNIGYKVRAVVSNLETEFLKFSESQGITRETPFIELEGRRIFYIFDVPSIMKSVRDNWMEHNYCFDGKTLTWREMRILFEFDRESLKFAPKLTYSHILPNKVQQQKLRFSTQIFSDSVTRALQFYIKAKYLELNDGFIEFIDLMNKVFDILNSNNPCTPELSKRPYRGKDFQRELLNKMEHFLNNLDMQKWVNGPTESVPFIDGFIITINSVIRLQQDLAKEYYDDEFPLLTRNLNNESLNNYLETLRKAAGKQKKYTSHKFQRAFRKTFLWQILKLMKGQKGIENLDGILQRYSNFISEPSSVVEDDDIFDKTIKASLKGYSIPQLDQSSKQALNRSLQICGFLLKKCYAYHDCQAYLPEEASEQPAPAHMLVYCQEMEQYFCKHFNSMIGEDIGKKLCEGMRSIKIFIRNYPCSCFPIVLLQRMFVSMRIRHLVKWNNGAVKHRNLRIDREPVTVALV